MTDASTSPVTPATPSFVEDLVDIWYAPSAVFARRAKSGFLAIMAFVTLAIGGLYFANRGVTRAIFEGEYRRQTAEVMRQNPSVTAEQMAQGRKFAEMAQSFGIFVGIPLALLCIGLGAWLVGKGLGAEELGFGAAIMIASWAYLPKVLEAIAVGAQGALIDTDAMTGRFQLSLGVGRFLDPDTSGGLLSLLGRIDIFTIWVSVLLGIGICVVGKVPRERVLAAAALMWVFGALPALYQLVTG
jgi:Yip1 domain